MKFDDVQKFYRSKLWKDARYLKIIESNGRCAVCSGIGNSVHHIIHLTPENVNDPNISINQDNLMLLCNKCHNEMHNRWCNKSGYYFDANGDMLKK